MTHHKTWFPIVVIALTVLLGLFIYSVFNDRIATSVQRTPVTALEYQSKVKSIIGTLPADLSAAASDTDHLVRVQKVREDLLQLFVPAEQKDVHLEMVMILTQWIAGFSGEMDKQDAASARWQILVSQNAFLQ